jgi:hypothetical protein
MVPKPKTFEEMVRENPDSFDLTDCRPAPSHMTPEYFEAAVPEHLKAALRTRRSAKLGRSQG